MNSIDHYSVYHAIESMSFNDGMQAAESEIDSFLQAQRLFLDGIPLLKDKYDLVIASIRDILHQVICVNLDFCSKKKQYDLYTEVYPIVLGIIISSSPIIVGYASLASLICAHYLPILCEC